MYMIMNQADNCNSEAVLDLISIIDSYIDINVRYCDYEKRYNDYSSSAKNQWSKNIEYYNNWKLACSIEVNNLKDFLNFIHKKYENKLASLTVDEIKEAVDKLSNQKSIEEARMSNLLKSRTWSSTKGKEAYEDKNIPYDEEKEYNDMFYLVDEEIHLLSQRLVQFDSFISNLNYAVSAKEDNLDSVKPKM